MNRWLDNQDMESTYLYAVKNGTDEEYSFFAPEEVNEQIKILRKGDRFEIDKTC